jgi:hypothetical protein
MAGLGEDVGELRSHWDVQNVNFPNDDLVMDKVEINLSQHASYVDAQLGWTPSRQ